MNNSIILSTFLVICSFLGAITTDTKNLDYNCISTSDTIRSLNSKSRDKLNFEIEKRRNYTLKLIDESTTTVTNIEEAVNNYHRKIILYFRSDKLIALVNRTFDQGGKIVAYKVFYFTKENKCDWYTIRKNPDTFPKTYTLLNDLIVESDVNSTPIILENPFKKEIIRSAKLSLDSAMLHFPEFKYSFDWK